MSAATLYESSDVHIRVAVAVSAPVDKALRWVWLVAMDVFITRSRQKRCGIASSKVSPRSPPQSWTTSVMLVRFRVRIKRKSELWWKL